jgi:hypothetical protein
VRQALALVLFAAAPLAAQLPADGQTSYARDARIRIPFELRTGGKATKVSLYVSYDSGPWQEYDSARQGQKKEFIFTADRDGPYAFSTMTYFSDGTTDPASKDQLVEQRRVVIDKTPPRILAFRAVTAADGAPGVEWEATDDHPDPRGIKLEFRWDGTGRFEPIDRGVPFQLRDSRHWQVKPADRMQVRLVVTDRAGNKADSDPVWVSGRDVDRGDPVPRGPSAASGTATGTLRDADVAPAGGRRSANPATLHYVNNNAVALNINAEVGPSGLTKAILWWADEKLDWTKWKQEVGPKQAVEDPNNPDRTRKIPVNFVFDAPKDGTYSFIIIVENHRGQNRPNPKKGDAGDVQVVIDTTPPVVELLSTPRVSPNGDRAATVDIRWKASDANIAPMPIKLEYRPARDGHAAWKAITPDWINNDGQFNWTAPNGEGYEFHIRVVCKDRAGNEAKDGTDRMNKPVNVDLAVPKVEWSDVVPGKGGGAGAGFPTDIPMIKVGPAPPGSKGD